METLKKKVVWITGSGRGIGWATAPTEQDAGLVLSARTASQKIEDYRLQIQKGL